MDDRVYFPDSRGGVRAYFPGNTFIYKATKKKKKKKQTCKRGKGKARDTRVFCNQIDHPSPISPVSTRSFDPVSRNMKRSSQPCNFKFDEFSINRQQIKGHSKRNSFPSFVLVFLFTKSWDARVLETRTGTLLGWRYKLKARQCLVIYGTRREDNRDRVNRLKSVSPSPSIYPSV